MAGRLDACDRVTVEYMFGLVAGGLDTDLELALLADDLLGLVHVHAGQLHAHVPGHIVCPDDGVNLGILGPHRINLIYKDLFYQGCSTR